MHLSERCLFLKRVQSQFNSQRLLAAAETLFRGFLRLQAGQECSSERWRRRRCALTPLHQPSKKRLQDAKRLDLAPKAERTRVKRYVTNASPEKRKFFPRLAPPPLRLALVKHSSYILAKMSHPNKQDCNFQEHLQTMLRNPVVYKGARTSVYMLQVAYLNHLLNFCRSQQGFGRGRCTYATCALVIF